MTWLYLVRNDQNEQEYKIAQKYQFSAGRVRPTVIRFPPKGTHYYGTLKKMRVRKVKIFDRIILKTPDFVSFRANLFNIGLIWHLYSRQSCDIGKQGCQIWHPNWVRCAPNWTNLGLFKICFSTFWRPAPKCTETDLKMSQMCPIWGQSDPIQLQNQTSRFNITTVSLYVLI